MSIVVLLSGCNNNQTGGNVPVIDLEDAFDNNCEYVNLSKYCKSIEYIPLETSYGSVFGTSMKSSSNIRADSNYVFIKDEQTYSIHIFSNKTGRHINTFNKRGRGPGEYPNFGFWDLQGEYNSDNFRIALDHLNSVFMYGKEGSFLHKIDAGYGDPWVSPNVFYVILTPNEEDNYIYTLDCERHYNPEKGGNDIYNYLVKRDLSGGAESKLIEKRVKPWQWCMTEFFTYHNILKYITSGQDSIFTVKDIDNISLEYLIDLGKYEHFREIGLSIESGPALRYEPASRLISENEYFIVLKGLLPTRYLPQIFLRGGYDKWCPSLILYDKKEQKTYALKRLPEYDYIGLVNDLDGGMPFAPICVKHNKMYQFIEADDFIELAERHNVPRMKEIAATLTDESNPVMVVATLKE